MILILFVEQRIFQNEGKNTKITNVWFKSYFLGKDFFGENGF